MAQPKSITSFVGTSDSLQPGERPQIMLELDLGCTFTYGSEKDFFNAPSPHLYLMNVSDGCIIHLLCSAWHGYPPGLHILEDMEQERKRLGGIFAG